MKPFKGYVTGEFKKIIDHCFKLVNIPLNEIKIEELKLSEHTAKTRYEWIAFEQIYIEFSTAPSEFLCAVESSVRPNYTQFINDHVDLKNYLLKILPEWKKERSGLGLGIDVIAKKPKYNYSKNEPNQHVPDRCSYTIS